MITIEVDCNNDKVRIKSDGFSCEIPVKYPTQHVAVLEELLNILDVSGTELIKIDEDTSRTIGEW